jgi:hypothetical protein
MLSSNRHYFVVQRYQRSRIHFLRDCEVPCWTKVQGYPISIIMCMGNESCESIERTFCTTSENTCWIPILVFALLSTNNMPLLRAQASPSLRLTIRSYSCKDHTHVMWHPHKYILCRFYCRPTIWQRPDRFQECTPVLLEATYLNFQTSHGGPHRRLYLETQSRLFNNTRIQYIPKTMPWAPR